MECAGRSYVQRKEEVRLTRTIDLCKLGLDPLQSLVLARARCVGYMHHGEHRLGALPTTESRGIRERGWGAKPQSRCWT